MSGDWLTLLGLALVLGMRHGLDADHLVAVDGLTRFNSLARPALARWCGALFSLGHGVVVIAVALSVDAATQRGRVPAWFEDLGAWISILFLALLGILNLAAAAGAARDGGSAPVGLRARVLARLTRTSHPVLIAAVGALFAISFDTLSQATLFALLGTRFGGLGYAALLGGLFTVGMLLADGVNGLWIAALLRRADQRARIASRVMGVAVALLSLAAAALGAARYAWTGVASWYEGRELTLGVMVVGFAALAFVLAHVLARRAPSADARTTG